MIGRSVQSPWFGDSDPGRFAGERAIGVAGVTFAPPVTVTLSPAGRDFQVVWTGIEGANRVAVSSAQLRLRAEEQLVHLSQLDVSEPKGGFRAVAIGQGRRVRSLKLTGLKMVRDTQTVNVSGASGLGGDSRLVVVVEQEPGAGLTARFAYPGIEGGDFAGDILPKVEFADGVVHLPDVAAVRIGVAIVLAGERNPASFEKRAITVDSISAVAVEVATALQLSDADGRVLWATPELPPGQSDVVDLRIAVEGAFRQALAEGRPLDTRFRLTGQRGIVRVEAPIATGRLQRVFPGVLRVDILGEPVPLPIGGALPATAPISVHADVSYRYAGIRLLAGLVDNAPPAGTPTEGVVVGDRPYLHPLPPSAADGFPLARIALYGRAPEACELSVTPVDLSGGPPGRPLGPPGVKRLAPSDTFGFVWLDMPGSTVTGTVGLSVRANQGRFLWIGVPNPLLRVAVHDTLAAGRPVTLEGTSISAVTSTDKQTVPRATLPAARFAGHAPRLASDLFVTFDMADLTLEYAR